MATTPAQLGRTVPRTTHRSSGLSRRDFFDDVAARLKETLPAELAGFRPRPGFNLLKVSYGNDRIHYEVAIDAQHGLIEIGLHFEDGPVSTAAYLAYFDGLIVELKHDLGTQLELERWTASWGHLYELVPLPRLDQRLVDQVAARLAKLIAALEPLVRAAAIPPERSAAPAESRGPWRKWRRR